MIGFNFYPGSKRYISPEYAASFVDGLAGVTKVGVFVNASVEDILFSRKLALLDAIQLHGSESLDFIAELRDRIETTIIKAIRVRSAADLESVGAFRANAILLDAYSTVDFGGTGEKFDWRLAAEIGIDVKLFLAGGLNADNVAEAIRQVRPFAVDVASGVESSPRKKDPKKLEAFIRNAKNA